MKEPLVSMVILFLTYCIVPGVKSKDGKIAVLLPDDNTSHRDCIKAAVQMAIDDVNKLSYINQNGTIFKLSANYQLVSRSSSDLMLKTNRILDEPDTVAILGSPYHQQSSIVQDIACLLYTSPSPRDS